MSEGSCSRCGRKTTVEYGADGKPYCSSCIFYGNTKTCWRCRMYLPASELQQYKGQWVCPYCIMELRDEDRRMSNPPTTYKPKPLHATPIVRHEACERCGREAEFFYIWNGRKLCKSCLDEEQKKWGMAGGGPTASATRVVYNRGRDGLLGSIIRGILVKIGLIKQEQALRSEIVSAEPIKVKEGEGKKKKRKKNVVSFRYGKPLSEALEEEEMEEESKGEAGEQRSPESEGLMKSKPKKMPKKKAKSKKKKAKPKKAKPKKK